jgi:hypothetical protein
VASVQDEEAQECMNSVNVDCHSALALCVVVAQVTNFAVQNLRPKLHGYADTDTGTRYGDTPIRHFPQNADTGIRQYT